MHHENYDHETVNLMHSKLSEIDSALKDLQNKNSKNHTMMSRQKFSAPKTQHQKRRNRTIDEKLDEEVDD